MSLYNTVIFKTAPLLELSFDNIEIGRKTQLKQHSIIF